MRNLVYLLIVALTAGAVGAGAAACDNARRRAEARQCVHESNWTDTAVERCYTDRGVPLP